MWRDLQKKKNKTWWKNHAHHLNSRVKVLALLNKIPNLLTKKIFIKKAILNDWRNVCKILRQLVQLPHCDGQANNLNSFGAEQVVLGNQKYKTITLHALLTSYLAIENLNSDRIKKFVVRRTNRVIMLHVARYQHIN